LLDPGLGCGLKIIPVCPTQTEQGLIQNMMLSPSFPPSFSPVPSIRHPNNIPKLINFVCVGDGDGGDVSYQVIRSIDVKVFPKMAEDPGSVVLELEVVL